MNQQLKIKFLEDCLLVEDILIIGDLHLGFNEFSPVEGLIEKLERNFLTLEKEKIKVERVVLIGDIKHDFGGISDIEWRDVLKFLDYLVEKTGEKGKIIIIKGNHDNILGPIVKKRGIKLKEFYKLKIKGEEICFLHGDKNFKEVDKGNILILGHLHPSITLKDKYKSEKYKCFLKGTWRKKQVYILPGFSYVSLGYDLSDLGYDDKRKDFFIVENKLLKKFEVIVYNSQEDKVYNFWELKNLIKS